MFNLNVNDLAKACLAYFMRVPKLLSWMYTILRGVKDLYNDFESWSAEILYELGIDYQVVYLEKLLNDKYNGGMAAYSFDNVTFTYSPVVGAIYITDAADVIQPVYIWNKIEARPPIYLYNKAENKPPVYLYNQVEYDTHINFIIWIPTTLINIMTQPTEVAQINAWIRKYKLAGTNYIIRNY